MEALQAAWELGRRFWPALALIVQGIFLAGGWWITRQVRKRDRARWKGDTEEALEERQEFAEELRGAVERLNERIVRLEVQVEGLRADVDDNKRWVGLVTRQVVRKLGLDLDPDPDEGLGP